MPRKHPSEKLFGEAARAGVKLHRIHAMNEATRLQIDDLGMTWRGDGGDPRLKVDISHRLAVCWNVCEGMPTELLLSGVLRDLIAAVDAGDLAGAQAQLARMDRDIDRTDGRLHDCKHCLARDGSEAADEDAEEHDE